jgi:hypothetical protein
VTISDTEVEAGLRRLRTRADEIAPPAADLAQRTRERYRAQRRTRAAWAAGGLVAALVLLGVPVVASTIGAQPLGSEVATPSERTFTPSPPTGLYALPTRGGLADDEDWLAEVAALEWPDGAEQPPGIPTPDAPVDTRRVAFAGDVPSGRVALVLGMDGRFVAYTWLVGPRGADAGEMVPATSPTHAGPDDALILIDAPSPSAPTLTLVVVGQPGDRASRSLTPVVDAAGKLHTDRVDLDVRDGIGIAQVAAPWPWGGPAGNVQLEGVSRGAQMVDSDRLRGDRTQLEISPSVPLEDPRGLAGRTRREPAASMAMSMVTNFGLTEEQARPTLLAAGPLGARLGQYGELYGMTHPSGATSTWLLTYAPALPDHGAQIYEGPLAPAGTALLDRVIAVRAMNGLLVSAPAGVGAQVLDTAGAVLTTVPLEGGAGTGSLDEPAAAASVRIVDGDGDVLGEAPVTVIPR